MSEGMHSNPVVAANRSRGRLVLVVGGTALAVLAAGLSIQFFRAKPGAAEEQGAATVGAKKTRAGDAENPPLAKVGEMVISKEMVSRECLERHGAEVLDKLINRALIEVACQKEGITISESAVAAEIDKIAKRFNLDTANWLKMLKAERNITPEQYARDVIWPMLALKTLAGPDAKVTEEEVKKAFTRNYGPRVECKMIMCDNIRRAQAVWKETEGVTLEQFGALARQNSVEPTSRALDGDVPAIPRHSGNDNLEKVAFSLKPGEVSGIVEVGAPGNKKYAILMCKGHTKPTVTNLDEVRAELYEQVKEEKTQEAVAKVFERLKEEIRVDNYVANTVSGGSSEKPIRQTSATNRPEGAARATERTADPTRTAVKTKPQPK